MSRNNSNRRAHRDRSEDVLTFINEYSTENGRPPTSREIMRAVGLRSPSSVDYYYKKLALAKKIVRTKKTARSVKASSNSITRRSMRIIDIAGFGYIAAGLPIQIPVGYKLSDAMFTVEIPDSYVPAGIPVGDVFALKVEGDSMRDAMIHDGDVVLLYKTENVQTGDIVAAWLVEEHETTLKRYRKVKRGIWLDPENPSSAFKSRFFLPEEVNIQGKVLGVLRLYR